MLNEMGCSQRGVESCLPGEVCCGDRCLKKGSECCYDLGFWCKPGYVCDRETDGTAAIPELCFSDDGCSESTRPRYLTCHDIRRMGSGSEDRNDLAEQPTACTPRPQNKLKKGHRGYPRPTPTSASAMDTLTVTFTSTNYDDVRAVSITPEAKNSISTMFRAISPIYVHTSTVFWTDSTGLPRPTKTSKVITVLATDAEEARLLLSETASAITRVPEEYSRERDAML
ncbi:hypothetical protein TWF506_001451 [Arthrobotrys conoides]|uniref:Uncharacterized protein n=1 Tax=Arthrobotrys conoides TaxID=74498 RepID=A0AAN8P9U8_9PEZI